jgi:hypothetical protein
MALCTLTASALVVFGTACAEPGRASPQEQPAQEVPARAIDTATSGVGGSAAMPGPATPGPEAAASVAAPLGAPGRMAASSGGAAASPTPTLPATPPSAAAEPAPPGTDAELSPQLLAPDANPLPQTRERPRSDSPGLRLRLERLVEAIARDEPERALPAFFPRLAYERVKAVADPGRDWQTRLLRAFERDIHTYHQKLGPDAAGVQLIGLVINEGAVRWMDPGAEGNRLGYYRVTRSRLRLRLANGAERELPLTSLISWRGAWYVVHLNGFS